MLCNPPAVIKEDFITKAEYLQLSNYFRLGQQRDLCKLKVAERGEFQAEQPTNDS